MFLIIFLQQVVDKSPLLISSGNSLKTLQSKLSVLVTPLFNLVCSFYVPILRTIANCFISVSFFFLPLGLFLIQTAALPTCNSLDTKAIQYLLHCAIAILCKYLGIYS